MIPVEGGIADGREVPDYGSLMRYPVPMPWNVIPMRDPRLSMDVVEYRRSGKVYRWVGLIDDARAEMFVSEQAWREVRHMARRQLREELVRLAPGKQVDRIVWVLSRDPVRSMFRLVAVVGGRRAENARHLREKYRSGMPT